MTLPERAVKRVIFSDEAWYRREAIGMRDPGVIEDWNLGVDARNIYGANDGTHGEWTLNWYVFNGRDAWRLEIFGDGIEMCVASGFLALLQMHVGANRAQLRQALAEHGWLDLTPREDPYVRKEQRA